MNKILLFIATFLSIVSLDTKAQFSFAHLKYELRPWNGVNRTSESIQVFSQFDTETPLAIIVFHRYNDHAEIELLQVEEQYRNQGLGKELFLKGIEYLYYLGVRVIHWNAVPLDIALENILDEDYELQKRSQLVEKYKHFCNQLPFDNVLMVAHPEEVLTRLSLTLE